MGGSYTAPTPPDPAVTANVQGQINADTARLTQRMNLIDQVGPDGSVRYRRIGPAGTGTGVGVGGTVGSEGAATSAPFGMTPTIGGQPITQANFNEAAYFAANPDVKAAIDAPDSWLKSGWQHYDQYGRNEGRTWADGPTYGAGASPLEKLNLGINYSSPLNNGIIDPYQGLPGGKAEYDAIRRAAGFTGEFGNNAFENWLRGQDYNTQVKYINSLSQKGADPDYIGGLVRQLKPPAGASPYSADNMDRWEQVTELDPVTQQNVDKQKALTSQLYSLASGGASRIGSTLATPFDTAGLPDLRDAAFGDDLVAERGRVESALFDRINPQLERDRVALETRLRNQGVMPGSEAWKNAMDDLGRAQTDARLAITGQGLGELTGMFGMRLSDAQLANAARSQGLSERAYVRQIPINEITALLSGTQVSLPQATIPAPQVNVNPADYAGNVYANYQGALNAAQAQAQSSNAMWSNLFGLGGTLGAASILKPSDRRVKTDIKRVGTLDNDLPVYAYRYKSGGPMEIGVMAQDVEKENPEAVRSVFGMKMVDYDRATRKAA